MLLSLDTNNDQRYADGFSQKNVCAMFGMTGSISKVIALVQDGHAILSIPWPDDLTLDQALLTWARTVQAETMAKEK